MASSFWQTTCTAILAGTEPGWNEVADYRHPLTLLLAGRYSWLTPADREDLVHDILIDIKEQLYQRYSPERGRFRAFLCGVVRNKVLSRWKRNRRQLSLELEDEPAALSDAEGAAVSLVAEVLAAFRRWYERSSGNPQQMSRVYIVGAHLLRGESYGAIGEREGLSWDAVKRVIHGFRRDLLSDLLEHTLVLADEQRTGLAWGRLAEVVKQAFASPGERHRALLEVAQPAVRQALEEWIEAYQQALRAVAAPGTAEGDELLAGLQMIFGSD